MPVNILSTLNKPLPRLDIDAIIAAFWRWERRGLSYLVPLSLRHWRYRPRARLVALDDAEPLIVETSFFGLSRVRAASPADPPLPTRIALRSSDVFETRINLPAAAARRLGEAVALRLEELSPLPPSDVAVAVGPPQPAADGRIEATVALARKSAIEETRRALKIRDIASVGARPQVDGSLLYAFSAPAKRSTQIGAHFLSLAALVLSAAALAVAGMQHLDRRQQTLEAERLGLMKALKAHEVRMAPFLSGGAPPPTMAATAALEKLRAALAALPRPSFVEEMRVSPQKVEIVYFAREGATPPPNATLIVRPGIRRGYQPYSLALDQGAPR